MHTTWRGFFPAAATLREIMGDDDHLFTSVKESARLLVTLATVPKTGKDLADPETNRVARTPARSAPRRAPPETGMANSSALAATIAAVPHNGTVQVPAGRYLALPVALRGFTTLLFAPGAVLAAPRSRAGWPTLPARDNDGRMLGSWEGLPETCFAAPLHAIGAGQLIRHCLMERGHGGVVIV